MGLRHLTLSFLLASLQYARVACAAPSVAGKWQLVQEGNSGVSVMQVAVVSETKAVFFDQVENNPLHINGHSAWAAEIDLPSRTVRALNPVTNTWCATGSFLSNGTFVHTAGNPFVNISQGAIGQNGLQALRMYTPCDDGSCDLIENPRIRLTSARWYPSSARLDDGAVMILGGSMDFGYINNSTENNPTYEFFPPKNIHGFNGMRIPLKFLNDTLDGNQFPNVHTLPDGRLFVSANQQAMLFDWKTNTEIRLPNIPNGVRVSSPFSASAVTLPLTPANNYTPEIMICGGTAIDDKLPWDQYSSQTPNSDQCARMVLTKQGIAAGWKVEHMPEGRIMLELILLPDGRVLIVNGAKTGVAGWQTVHDPVGNSNADHPALTPVIYDPSAPAGKRFSTKGMPTSKIPRMYHSTATLIPDGSIMLGGSNPNPFTNTTGKYPSEWRLEFLSPPYMSEQRPTIISGVPKTIDFGREFTLNIKLPGNAKDVTVNLMDLGFATHGVHMDQKLVELKTTLSHDKKTIRVTAPSDGRLFSPGPGFLYIVTDKGVPSVGHRLIIGNGESPAVDEGAIQNMMANTNGSDPWYQDW